MKFLGMGFWISENWRNHPNFGSVLLLNCMSSQHSNIYAPFTWRACNLDDVVKNNFLRYELAQLLSSNNAVSIQVQQIQFFFYMASLTFQDHLMCPFCPLKF